jgi:hypothetical protein
MEVTTFQGVVENGKIELGESVKLPEKAIVYVVVPSLKITRNSNFEVIEETDDFDSNEINL